VENPFNQQGKKNMNSLRKSSIGGLWVDSRFEHEVGGRVQLRVKSLRKMQNLPGSLVEQEEDVRVGILEICG